MFVLRAIDRECLNVQSALNPLFIMESDVVSTLIAVCVNAPANVKNVRNKFIFYTRRKQHATH